MSNIYASPTKNFLTRNGFTMVSNLILDFQQELGITEGELVFIIRVMKNKASSVVHDEELDPNVSSRTLSRRRISLKEKGYLNYSIVKKQDCDGSFKTEGVMYDLSPLEEKLQDISNSLEKRKEERLEKQLKTKKIVDDSDIYLENYKKDYKNYYGVDYNINEYELKYYKRLNDDEKKILNYIFEYCKASKLLDRIVPRLSLFFKTKFRFDDLKRYCIDCGYINGSTSVEAIQALYKDLTFEEIDENEKLIKKFKEKYKCDDNDYKLKKVIERTCYRTTNEEIIVKIIDKFIRES